MPPPPRIRRPPPRRRTAIPTYSHSQGPNAQLTWVDRFVVRFPQGCIYYRSQDQLRAYLREVGRGDVFRFTGGRDNMGLRVRPGWLFGGEARVRHARALPGQVVQLELILELNATRFAVHNDRPVEQVRTLPAHEALSVDPLLRDEALAYSLDGNDNVFVTRRLGGVRTRYFRRMLPVYLSKVCELIEGAFPGATSEFAPSQSTVIRSVFEPGDRPRPVFAWGEWVVRQVEHFWEFLAPDAPLLVRSLDGYVEQISSDLRRVDYDVQRVPRGTLANSRSLNVHLGAQGVQLGIYAKAHDRLRVEVRHHKGPRRTYAARATTEVYPNDTIEELVSFLQFVRERAHERASVFFDALRGAVRTVPPTFDRLSALLDNVHRACNGDEFLVRSVLVLLAAHGRIVREGAPELCSAVDCLVRSGVLRRTRSTRRSRRPVYGVTGPYSGTLRVLRELVAREASQGTS